MICDIGVRPGVALFGLDETFPETVHLLRNTATGKHICSFDPETNEPGVACFSNIACACEFRSQAPGDGVYDVQTLTFEVARTIAKRKPKSKVRALLLYRGLGNILLHYVR